MFFVEARYHRDPDRAGGQVRYISHREQGLTDGRRRELYGIDERYRAFRGDEVGGGSRELRVVGRSTNDFKVVRPATHHLQVWEHSVEVRRQDRLDPSVVHQVEQMLVAGARRDVGVDQAEEELLPVLTRLKQVLDDGGVVVRLASVTLVPGVFLQPAQPVAALHIWIIGMATVRLAIGPLRRNLDDLVAEGNTGLLGSPSSKQENWLGAGCLQEQRSDSIRSVNQHVI